MVNTKKLRERMLRMCVDDREMCRRMGWSTRRWTQRMRYPERFTVEDIRRVSAILSIRPSESDAYFFARSVAFCNRTQIEHDKQDGAVMFFCADCGCDCFKYDALTNWRGFALICDCCLRARVGEMDADELAALTGMTRLTVSAWQGRQGAAGGSEYI